MSSTRIFRLFVSSTFSDFVAERAALQQRVFPELEKFCAELGARFQAIDLRWGITEQAQQQHDTLRICLEEVRRCQELSPRPNFAVLLGDRYGWEPVPARIPDDHWSRLQSAGNPQDCALMTESYRFDENAVPPVYCLRVGVDEPRLLAALRRAARNFRGKARLPYFASATHQEIALGALSRRDEQGHTLLPEQHVHVYVRRIQDLPQDANAADFIDWVADKGKPVPGGRARLRTLEKSLRKNLAANVHTYDTNWQQHGLAGAIDECYLDQFCQDFMAHQRSLIQAELDSAEQTDDRDIRQQLHQRFGAERARVFAGRSDLLESIASYTAARPAKSKTHNAAYTLHPSINSPLVLLGAGGSGKSALLARAVQNAVNSGGKPSKTVVMQRYIGVVPGGDTLMSLLQDLNSDIAHAYQQPEPPTPQGTKQLAEQFATVLEYATAKRPLHLYIDALDQLNNTDGGLLLDWLPSELPTHVRIVVSVRAGTVVEQSACRRYPNNMLDVPLMTAAEGSAMLDAWLQDKRSAWFNAGIAPATGRRLTAEQQQAIMQAFSNNGSALWLKLAYEEATTWRSWDPPRTLPTSVEALIEDFIDTRLLKGENHPQCFTEHALAYLTAARFGLSEDELARVLGTDAAVRAEFQANEKTQRKWDESNILPPIIWSRLYFDLQPYLGQVQMDGAILLRWFHREFAEVLATKYLGTDEDKQSIHGALADTFRDLEKELRPLDETDDTLFLATDASGQQVSAALRRVMEQPWQLAHAGRQDERHGLLTDFGFCMGKCAANQAEDLLVDMAECQLLNAGVSSVLEWTNFLRKKSHLLRRGNKKWPAHKIMLQVSVEEADGSLITIAAEKWLNADHCDWMWLRSKNRPNKPSQSDLLAVLEGHTDSVIGALELPDGRLLSWSRDDTLRLWDGTNGLVLAILEGHADVVSGALMLSDGRLLSWSVDGTLRLWDDTNGSVLAVLEGHTDSVSGAYMLLDGRLLSWSYDGTLRLWDDASGEALAVLEGHTKSVEGALELHGGRLLSWSNDGTLRLWCADSGEALAVLEGHTDSVKGALELHGGRLLSWSNDGTLRLWNYASGEALAVLEGHTEYVSGAQMLSDGRLLSWSADGTLRLWDDTNGSVLVVLEGHTDFVSGAHMLLDGRLLSWSYDGTLQLWDGSSGAASMVLGGHRGYVEGVKVLSNVMLMSWSTDGTIRLWDGFSGSVLAVLGGHTESVSGACELSDGRLLSWSDDSTLRLWDSPSAEALAVPEGDNEATGVRGALLLPDGRLLSFCVGGSLWLWDGVTGVVVGQLEGHTGYVPGIHNLPDGRLLTWSWDGTLRLWDGKSGGALAVLEGHTDRVTGAQALTDGRLVSWSRDATIRLWDGVSGAALVVMRGHTGPIESVQKLADGRLLSISTWDDTVRLWDAVSGEALAILEENTGVSGVQVLPDDRLLTWYEDESCWTYFLSDVHSGEVLNMLVGEGPVGDVQVLPDGLLLMRSRDCTLQLWGGKSGGLGVLVGHTEFVTGAKGLPAGRLLSWSGDCTLRLWDLNTYTQIQLFHHPWIETVPYPAPWEDENKIDGAFRDGELWIQAWDEHLSVADRRQKANAKWHGQDIRLIGSCAGRVVATGNRKLLFLNLMEGNQQRMFSSHFDFDSV